jgi:hypothetical protein
LKPDPEGLIRQGFFDLIFPKEILISNLSYSLLGT